MNGKIDYFVAAASSGGTITGVGKFLKECDPNIKIIMPDPKGSVFQHYFKYRNVDVVPEPYELEGTGKDHICDLHDFSLIDDVVTVH